ncbi:MAG: adenosylcobinamide-phosphate synthase CbiB [Isosphaeraceae bacterium]
MSGCAWNVWALPAGVALDLLLGDPRGWPHPVRAIGWLIVRTERVLRGLVALSGRPGLEYLAGVCLVVVVVGATAGVVRGLLVMGERSGGVAPFLAESLLVYWGLAIRSLREETLRASDEPELDRSRQELAWIVGRDTATLDRDEICRACVETLGENTHDAIVAPLFWYAMMGPVGLWVYKAINTLDSMTGYRDARYRRFGWASARVDDLAGLLPSRLTWILISLSAGLVGEDARGALRVGWRDGRKHPSPNAAWGEAAMAGALGVRLGGVSTYGGVASEKPRIGDQRSALEPDTVRRASRLMTATALVAAALCWSVRAWVLRRA